MNSSGTLYCGTTRVLYGAGEHGRVVLDSALSSGTQIALILDDAPRENSIRGIPLHKAADFHFRELPGFLFIVGIGDNNTRALVFRRLSGLGTALNVIHPFTSVSPGAALGNGIAILAGAVVNAGSIIGHNVILNTSSSIDHDCKIEDHCHICPGVHLAGNVKVGEYSVIGIGTSVIPGVSIGRNCIIGAGSTVVRDIPDNSVAFGNPARVVRRNEEQVPG